jgi:hypothetical protein
VWRPELAGDVVVVADVDLVQVAAAVDQAGFLERGLGGLPCRIFLAPMSSAAPNSPDLIPQRVLEKR